MKNPVQMAVIGAPHGIRGELRVKTFTGDPEALGDYGPLSDEQGRSFTVEAIRPAGTVAVVRFAEVKDRSTAEALNGTALFVERAALPTPQDEEEFYHADLAGLSVQDGSGNGLGKIVAVQNFGGGDILQVRLSSGGEALIPFTMAAVPRVALSAGFIEVDPVAAGLVDDEDGPQGAGGDR